MFRAELHSMLQFFPVLTLRLLTLMFQNCNDYYAWGGIIKNQFSKEMQRKGILQSCIFGWIIFRTSAKKAHFIPLEYFMVNQYLHSEPSCDMWNKWWHSNWKYQQVTNIHNLIQTQRKYVLLIKFVPLIGDKSSWNSL